MAVESPKREAEDVRAYFEGGWSGGRVEAPSVQHLEKVASEHVWGRRHDVWDVHSTNGRWWVVTNPMNLYTQDDFKSMDVVLTFHVGLMARVAARREPQAGDEEHGRLAATWRQWQQAVGALDQAVEAEEFQAVGMRLREALLTFVREVANEAMLAPGEDAPKLGDFIHWSEHVATTIASGSSAEALRSYLKAIARETWQYVAALTHKNGAARHDAELGAGMVDNLIGLFGLALVRWERGRPDSCPACGSYRIAGRYSDGGDDANVVSECGSCGWVSDPRPVVADELARVDHEPPEGDCVLTSDISTFVRPSDAFPPRLP
jgi:hypothetical protein